LTTPTTDRSTTCTSSGTFRSGSARLGLSQKDGLPIHRWRYDEVQGHRRARKGEACGLPLSLSAVRLWQEKTPAGLPTAGVLAVVWCRGCPARRAIVAHRRLAIGKEKAPQKRGLQGTKRNRRKHIQNRCVQGRKSTNICVSLGVIRGNPGANGKTLWTPLIKSSGAAPARKQPREPASTDMHQGRT